MITTGEHRGRANRFSPVGGGSVSAASQHSGGLSVERLVRWTRGWAFVGALIVLYVLFGLRALSDDRYLHDEGILTFTYAEFLRRDFVATFFWLKSHPALALLNLPGAALGLDAFFVAHVLIGAAGVLCIAIAARRAGVREVGIAPLAVATSPLYVVGGASGIGNVDGAAVAAGALALCLGGSPGVLAGLVAGILPFIRFELGLLTLTLALIGIRTPLRWRFLAGVAALPFGYVAAGALYHGALLWFIEFPPAWRRWDVASPVMAGFVRSISVGALVRSVGLTLPALPLLLLLRHGGAPRRPFEVPLLAYVVVFLAAITLLPFARIAFGFDDRYYLTALPVVALLAARAADCIPDLAGASHRLPRALAAIACAVAAAVSAAWGLAGISLATAVIAATGARLAAGSAIAAALSATMLVGFAATLPRGYRGHPQLEAVTQWLRDHRAEVRELPIYTNLKLLSAFASRSGDTPGFRIAGLIQPDMRKELLDWSNPDNGQRERIWRLAHDADHLRGADPVDIVEGRVPAGAVLVLDTDDIRTEQMFSQRFLEAQTQTRLRSAEVLIATVRPPDAGAADAQSETSR